MTVTLPGQKTGLLLWHFLIIYWFVAIAISCFRQWQCLVKRLVSDLTMALPGQRLVYERQRLVCDSGISWSDTGLWH